ncbi:hypothetical protein ACJX0J_026070, partial [Zea mays]
VTVTILPKPKNIIKKPNISYLFRHGYIVYIKRKSDYTKQFCNMNLWILGIMMIFQIINPCMHKIVSIIIDFILKHTINRYINIFVVVIFYTKRYLGSSKNKYLWINFEKDLMLNLEEL